ncbi:ankyrin repeat domain-containing protein [Wolbachia endosymbiont (group A) of Epagoge grotiana]|uniref:ankyrin repeat domain-containing protein n=1 Tax=Wolbachia endosymbiont (group A) of Epagoge grotiana TaxID=2954006 RepID=UPI002231693D|nr:ankyrin repeat domain-containing protein [Wolbachia endosymbiont (group A) of Epagoge grotiana]
MELVNSLIKQGANVCQESRGRYIPLHLAARAGNVEMINALIEQGAKINQMNNDRFTPLHFTVQVGDVDVVNALLARSANVNEVGKYGFTPLHFAAQVSNAEVIRALIERGAGVNQMNSDESVFGSSDRYAYGSTPLHLAIEKGNFEAVNCLLEEGADINQTDGYGRTPLHLAIEEGNFEAVNALVGRGADVNKADRYERTPLYLAVQLGNLEMVNALVGRGADINKADKYERTPLNLAVQLGNAEIINALIAHEVGDDICTPLHLAVLRNDMELVNSLIERGVDVNKANKYGFTPLHFAVRSNNIQMVDTLIKRGADVNRVSRSGYTVLHWAVKSNNIQAVNTLIEQGAEIKDVDYPLDWAVGYEFQDIAKLLMEHEVKLKGCNVRKPRDIVQHNPDLEIEASEYIDRCVNEIEGIKKEIINGNVTFYDLLTSKGDKLASLMLNKDIVTVLEKGEYKSKFPTYSKIMESQYEIGKENLHLFNRALEAIFNLFVVKNLPLEIGEMIVKYLPSSFDRKSLIKLVEVKGLPNEKVIERRSSLEHKTIPTTQTVQDILTQIRGILDNQQIEVNDLLTLEFATSAGYYDYWLQQIDIARAARLLYQFRTEGNHTFEVANLEGNDGNEPIVGVLNQFRENEEQQRLTLIITLNNAHWVTLVIERQNGNYVGYYADSTATAVPGDITDIIQNNLGNNIRINNVSVSQQTDGWNCGLWALENANSINRVLNENPVGKVQNIINIIRDFLERGHPKRDRNYFQNIRVGISQLFRNDPGFQDVQLQAYIQNREQIDPLLRTYLELGYHRVGGGYGLVEAPISLGVSDPSNFGDLPQSSLEGPEASRVSDLSKGKGGR